MKMDSLSLCQILLSYLSLHPTGLSFTFVFFGCLHKTVGPPKRQGMLQNVGETSHHYPRLVTARPVEISPWLSM